MIRRRSAFCARSVAVVTLLGAVLTSPIAERVGRVVVGRRWRWWRRVAARRRRLVIVDPIVGHTRRAALRAPLAFDDAAERRHALRVQFDVERRQVERRRLDHVDLAAAVAVARHDVDVARPPVAAIAAPFVAVAAALTVLLALALLVLALLAALALAAISLRALAWLALLAPGLLAATVLPVALLPVALLATLLLVLAALALVPLAMLRVRLVARTVRLLGARQWHGVVGELGRSDVGVVGRVARRGFANWHGVAFGRIGAVADRHRVAARRIATWQRIAVLVAAAATAATTPSAAATAAFAILVRGDSAVGCVPGVVSDGVGRFAIGSVRGAIFVARQLGAWRVGIARERRGSRCSDRVVAVAGRHRIAVRGGSSTGRERFVAAAAAATAAATPTAPAIAATFVRCAGRLAGTIQARSGRRPIAFAGAAARIRRVDVDVGIDLAVTARHFGFEAGVDRVVFAFGMDEAHHRAGAHRRRRVAGVVAVVGAVPRQRIGGHFPGQRRGTAGGGCMWGPAGVRLAGVAVERLVVVAATATAAATTAAAPAAIAFALGRVARGRTLPGIRGVVAGVGFVTTGGDVGFPVGRGGWTWSRAARQTDGRGVVDARLGVQLVAATVVVAGFVLRLGVERLVAVLRGESRLAAAARLGRLVVVPSFGVAGLAVERAVVVGLLRIELVGEPAPMVEAVELGIGRVLAAAEHAHFEQVERFEEVRAVQEALDAEALAGVRLQESVLHAADALQATGVALGQPQGCAQRTEHVLGDRRRRTAGIARGLREHRADQQGAEQHAVRRLVAVLDALVECVEGVPEIDAFVVAGVGEELGQHRRQRSQGTDVAQ